MSRVRIGTCSGPADAAIVRSMFAAHGIESVVGGELHANMLGGLGGGLIALDITVAEDDAEAAVELLREFREGESEAPPESADTESESDETDAADSGPDLTFDRRKRTGIALLLAVCISFGTAHMYARAWSWGFGLLLVEVGGFVRMATNPSQGAMLVFGAILTDAIGAFWRIRSGSKPTLPVARTR